jgi:YHS domain-containing protein
MGFFSRLIRFVFWVLIVTWVVKLLGRLMRGGSRQEPAPGASGAAAEDQARSGKRLVRDPICGMHMAEELALPMGANGETQYFCSEECRAKYESSILRRAANA